MTNGWLASFILASASLFAEENLFEVAKMEGPTASPTQNEKTIEPMAAPTIAAYASPARIDVHGRWDLYVQGSFLYWQPTQDNIDYAYTCPNPSSITGTVDAPAINKVVNFDTSYQPAFQVGLGMSFDCDDWDTFLQYTWFHTNNRSSVIAPPGGGLIVIRGLPFENQVNSFFQNANAQWNLKMDFIDWELGRSYYLGKKLTFRPWFGLRAAWIRQKFNSLFFKPANPDLFTPEVTLTQADQTVSWGLGGEAGVTANYLFGKGFRVVGEFYGDLLYTHYRLTTHGLSQGQTSPTFDLQQTHYWSIRPHIDLELGLGWGSYFSQNRYHFDLTATYGFQVFWNQNMFRHFTDSQMFGSSSLPNGNLYIQGLTVTARFDF